MSTVARALPRITPDLLGSFAPEPLAWRTEFVTAWRFHKDGCYRPRTRAYECPHCLAIDARWNADRTVTVTYAGTSAGDTGASLGAVALDLRSAVLLAIETARAAGMYPEKRVEKPAPEPVRPSPAEMRAKTAAVLAGLTQRPRF